MRTFLLAVAFVGSVGSAAAQPSYWTDIGYAALQARLGAATPTGAGIAVSQIEAQEATNAYLPNAASFTGKTITDVSGGGSVSGHATSVGANFYGSDSIAPGITTIYAYRVDGTLAAGDWLGPAYLNLNTGFAPLTPRSPAPRVQNFSFVATTTPPDTPDDAVFRQAQQRLDFAVERDNFVAVVGVNNGAGAIPALFANGYNTIAVGLTNGNSSVGPTTGDGIGRSKPDIVAPSSATSFATPIVSAAAALLLNVADAKSGPEATNAGKAETIKAVLMSGATKSEFAGLAKPWTRDTVTVGSDTFVRPLDSRFGAGELNIDNSHQILSQTQAVGTDQVVDGQYGWDFQTVTGVGAKRTYFIDVPTVGVTSPELTATVTWMRQIPQSGPSAGTATLSDVFLRLYESNASFTLGTLVDQSVSPIDNVQHLYTTGLRPGQRYAIEVELASLPTGQLSEDFAVAWYLSPVPEPAGVLAVAAVAVIGYVRARRGGSANRR